jgi:hypothetical protein
VYLTYTVPVPVEIAVSFEPAFRAVRVGATGVGRFCEEPAMSWYSSELCYCSLSG